ncbi:hypothetical protein FO522_12235 [Bacillus nitratireducens]|nr:hypothetical protein [Bacillus nitratireducens]
MRGAKLINIHKSIHEEILPFGKMIVSQTIFQKESFTRIITNFKEYPFYTLMLCLRPFIVALIQYIVN